MLSQCLYLNEGIKSALHEGMAGYTQRHGLLYMRAMPALGYVYAFATEMFEKDVN